MIYLTCVANETEDLNLRVFKIITGINDSKIVTKHISCKCKFKFDSKKCSSNQKWNNKSQKNQKNIMCATKIVFGILLHVIVKMQILQKLQKF